MNSLKGQPVFHLFVIEVENREISQAYFHTKGIETAIHYPVPGHKHRSLQGLVKVSEKLVVSERLASKILSVPIYPGMSLTDKDRVYEALLDCP